MKINRQDIEDGDQTVTVSCGDQKQVTCSKWLVFACSDVLKQAVTNSNSTLTLCEPSDLLEVLFKVAKEVAEYKCGRIHLSTPWYAAASPPIKQLLEAAHKYDIASIPKYCDTIWALQLRQKDWEQHFGTRGFGVLTCTSCGKVVVACRRCDNRRMNLKNGKMLAVSVIAQPSLDCGMVNHGLKITGEFCSFCGLRTFGVTLEKHVQDEINFMVRVLELGNMAQRYGLRETVGVARELAIKLKQTVQFAMAQGARVDTSGLGDLDFAGQVLLEYNGVQESAVDGESQ